MGELRTQSRLQSRILVINKADSIPLNNDFAWATMQYCNVRD